VYVCEAITIETLALLALCINADRTGTPANLPRALALSITISIGDLFCHLSCEKIHKAKSFKIATTIKAAVSLDIGRHAIKTLGHIKKVGSYTVKISLGHNVVASATVIVAAE